MKYLTEIFCSSPVAVVAHDAGAANILIGWIKRLDRRCQQHCIAMMQGPAEKIWRTELPHLALEQDLFSRLEDIHAAKGCLLSGTGWSSELEHQARVIAKSLGMPTMAVIDHWVNYRERFVRGSVEVLPDEIWVADTDAYAIARQTFPQLPVFVFDNDYLNGLVEKVLLAKKTIPTVCEVLYALEPVRLDWSSDDPRPGEFQALDYFMQHRLAAGIPLQATINLRPHPSDPPGKYDAWIEHRLGMGDDVQCKKDEPLDQAIARAGWVVGLESYVLVIAMAASKLVISTLPPWGNPCRLPHKQLQHLQRCVPMRAAG